MHAVGIVAAAGSGLRLGADRPKALVPLGGRALVCWAVYSFDWLIQILVLFGVVNGVLVLFPQTQDHHLLFAFYFGLVVGLGTALVAFLAFLCKATKAHLLGPNPTYALPAPLEGHIDV